MRENKRPIAGERGKKDMEREGGYRVAEVYKGHNKPKTKNHTRITDVQY